MNTLRSIHNPDFAHLDNAAVLQLYTDTDRQRAALVARADAGEEVWDNIDALDTTLFRIDDELCARNLDLPSTK